MVLQRFGPHLAFLTERIVIIYHTQPDYLHVIGSQGTLTAYVVDMSNGGLIRKQEWRTVRRQDMFAGKDSEASISPLSQGRYVVMAGGVLYLYDSNGSLLKEKSLGAGLWAVQSVDRGAAIVLRHGNDLTGGAGTKYLWLDSQTLETKAVYGDTKEYRSLTAMLAVGGYLEYGDADGIHILSPIGEDRLLCSDQFCRESGLAPRLTMVWSLNPASALACSQWTTG